MIDGSNRFEIAARVALNACPGLLYRWLPSGKLVGHEYDALNPTRVDRTLGSFRVNIQTGKWADFASDAKGATSFPVCLPLPDFAIRRRAGR